MTSTTRLNGFRITAWLGPTTTRILQLSWSNTSPTSELCCLQFGWKVQASPASHSLDMLQVSSARSVHTSSGSSMASLTVLEPGALWTRCATQHKNAPFFRNTWSAIASVTARMGPLSHAPRSRPWHSRRIGTSSPSFFAHRCSQRLGHAPIQRRHRYSSQRRPRRIHRSQTNKTKGLKMHHVKAIMETFAFYRQSRDSSNQLELAFGIAVAVGFKLLLRYDDLAKCRCEDGRCDIFPTHVRFYLSHRKNSQYRGQLLDIAKPEDPNERDVYNLCCLGKKVLLD